MRTEKLPLTEATYKNSRDEQLTVEGALLMDGYIDVLPSGSRYVRRRPGLLSWMSDSGGVDGPVRSTYWSSLLSRVLMTWDAQISKVDSDGANTDYSASLGSAVRHIWASDGTRDFVASGGRIIHFDGATVTNMADADAPTTVTHIAYIDGYLLAITGANNKVYFSNVNDALTWDAIDFFSAAANPDIINALHIRNGSIYLFGPKTIELWRDDGETPFSRISGGFIEEGLSAPYSVIVRDEGLFFLNHNRTFSRVVGTQVEHISTPYDKVIDGFSSVEDCVGDYFKENGQEFLTYSFAQGNRTLAYNLKTQEWSEFGRYRGASASYDRWLGNTYCYSPTWNKHIIGSNLEKKLFLLSSEYQTDDGAVIRTAQTTGHIDHGVKKRKRTKEIRLAATRGQSDTAGTLMLRYKIDNGQWGREVALSLGALGISNQIVKYPHRKIYRSVQYEVSCSDAVPVMFGEAEEDFDEMTS